MANYTIGPKIGLDGEKEFKAQIKNINSSLKALDSELKLAASEFEDNADSQEALTRQNEILNKKIEENEKKVLEAKKALEALSDAQQKGSQRWNYYQTILNNTNTDLNKLRSQVKKNESAINSMDSAVEKADDSIDELGDSADSAADKTSKFSKVAGGMKAGFTVAAAGVGAVVGAVAGGVSAINNIAEETREYREDMGKLTTAFETAGISQKAATDTYKDFYSVLGEEDRSVEAVNHLAKLTTSQKDLEKWTNICAGVWGTFGDSLPIEGLTEAANETAKTGTVTGVLADALNWAGVSEDDFNEQLAKCSTEQERASLITNTLNGLYKEAAENYREANSAIIDARKAQSELTDATAKLGEAAEPVSTTFKYMGAEMLNSIVPGVQKMGEGLNGILSGDESSGEQLGEGLAEVFDALIQKSNEMLPIVTSVLNTFIPQFLESVIQQLPTLIESGMSILYSLVDGILNALPSLLEAALQIIIYLAESLTAYLPKLIPTIINVILEIVKVLTDPKTLTNLIMAAVELILALAQGLVDAVPQLTMAVPIIIENLISAIINLLPELIPVSIQILSMLAQGFIQNVTMLTKAVPILIQSLINGFLNSDAFTDAEEWGKDFIQNIINGIMSMITNIRNAVSNVAETIASYLHFSVPDVGPLVSVPKWMPDMINEMTKGIYANEDKLKTAAGSLAGALSAGMTIDADVKNIGAGPSELTFNSPVYLDGKLISNNTQTYITNQQAAYAMSKGKLNVRF